MSQGLLVLLDAIALLAEQLPPGIVEPLADALASAPPTSWDGLRRTAQGVIAAPQYREQVASLVATWQAVAPDVAPASVALALRAAAHAVDRQRQTQRLELVWTGPDSLQPLRRTAQVLEDLIDSARRELLVVSFAVYDIPEIGQALARAARRGVAIRLVIESARTSEGRLTFDGLAAFGAEVVSRSEVFRWPAEHRARDSEGRPGSLHAKCAVADAQALLISSANLTHYALSLNMELGVLVRGGPLPLQVQQHFVGLINTGALVRELAGVG